MQKGDGREVFRSPEYFIKCLKEVTTNVENSPLLLPLSRIASTDHQLDVDNLLFQFLLHHHELLLHASDFFFLLQ